MEALIEQQRIAGMNSPLFLSGEKARSKVSSDIANLIMESKDIVPEEAKPERDLKREIEDLIIKAQTDASKRVIREKDTSNMTYQDQLDYKLVSLRSLIEELFNIIAQQEKIDVNGLQDALESNVDRIAKAAKQSTQTEWEELMGNYDNDMRGDQ